MVKPMILILLTKETSLINTVLIAEDMKVVAPLNVCRRFPTRTQALEC
jgi:hypothetical protein